MQMNLGLKSGPLCPINWN